MNEKLVAKKVELLKRITIKEYRTLLAFLEEVYLAEFELKILMARKFSNLFLALLELLREEDGGRVHQLYLKTFPNPKDEPIVIADRAIAFYYDEIRDGKYKKILIIDDVIIHGRTIDKICTKLEDWLPKESNIDVAAYASNELDLLESNYIQNAHIEDKCSLGECRAYSRLFVNLFYMMGQPCTSYVPNLSIDLETELGRHIKRFINEQKLESLMQDVDSKYMGVKAYAWISQEHWKHTLFQSVRFYVDDKTKQCVMVPMVSLMPINKKVLKDYYNILKDFFLEEFVKKVKIDCDIYLEINYRAVVYILSALWGRYFLKELGTGEITMQIESDTEEKMNFGTKILNQEKLKNWDRKAYRECFDKLQMVHEEIAQEDLLGISQDFLVLGEEISKLKGNDLLYGPQNFVAKFLEQNGKIDEEIWKKSNKKIGVRRLIGYPVCLLAEHMKEKYANEQECFRAILQAIDFGNGSIVAKKIEVKGEKYFVSLIHDGENNYKYTEEKYFSVLYGLFCIESDTDKLRVNQLEIKKKFIGEYKRHAAKNGHDINELEEMLDINVIREYKPILLRKARYLSADERDEFGVAVRLATNLIKEGV